MGNIEVKAAGSIKVDVNAELSEKYVPDQFDLARATGVRGKLVFNVKGRPKYFFLILNSGAMGYNQQGVTVPMPAVFILDPNGTEYSHYITAKIFQTSSDQARAYMNKGYEARWKYEYDEDAKTFTIYTDVKNYAAPGAIEGYPHSLFYFY